MLIFDTQSSYIIPVNSIQELCNSKKKLSSSTLELDGQQTFMTIFVEKNSYNLDCCQFIKYLALLPSPLCIANAIIINFLHNALLFTVYNPADCLSFCKTVVKMLTVLVKCFLVLLYCICKYSILYFVLTHVQYLFVITTAISKEIYMQSYAQ